MNFLWSAGDKELSSEAKEGDAVPDETDAHVDDGMEVKVKVQEEEPIAKLDELTLEKMSIDIQTFLAECAAKDVNIPGGLKQSLCSTVDKKSASSDGSSQFDFSGSFALSYAASIKKDVETEERGSYTEFLEKNKLRLSEKENSTMQKIIEAYAKLKTVHPEYELRVENGSYTVTNYFDQDPNNMKEEDDGKPRRAKQTIDTVVTQSLPVKVGNMLWRFLTTGKLKRFAAQKQILQGVNLFFESGKMYLVLGAPGSGKSTLLKMIAKLLIEDKGSVVSGSLSFNSIKPNKKNYWSNLVAYMDQIDRLHPYLTVKETFQFAWHCRHGGTHRRKKIPYDQEGEEFLKKIDDEQFLVEIVMESLGLKRVENTFVGDQEAVRGVSGGEKKRVTVGEMMCCGVPLLCCDEISTGLDAATTYDITRFMAAVSKINHSLKIVSLLQPSPETVANFDEIILLSEGRVIYSGPTERVVEYFNSLGYDIPDRMDLADWLQALPTKDGAQFFKAVDNTGIDSQETVRKHLSSEQFQERFYSSELGQNILERLKTPLPDDGEDGMFATMASVRYTNNSFKSLRLLASRELLLWWRDKYFIKARALQTLVFGIVVGTVFYQAVPKDPSNVLSIAFNAMLYAVVGAMTLIRNQFPNRSMFYKHQDANIFPTWTHVAARSLSQVPTSLIDALGFGTMIFWLTGFSYNDGASPAQYFIFLLLMFIAALSSGLVFSIFSSIVKDVTKAQAFTALTSILIILFSGFTVAPDVIPRYYIWAYWLNCFAWLLRGFILNEFESGAAVYEKPSGYEDYKIGETILIRLGQVDRNGEPFTFVWTWWGILFSLAFGLMMTLLSVFFMNHIRFATGGSLVTDEGDDEIDQLDAADEVDIPFTRASLSFKNVHYVVEASTSDEKLELLKGVDGVIEAGKMTALMGSSGAGKTTLMDVLAMRKTSGEITGDIRLNGHPQEQNSFRRCAGYVEQFDVQSAQLTIRETVDFSAKMRLDSINLGITEKRREQFVDQVLSMLELTNQQDLQVGTDESGGLSFEQRKRLSIAIEVAANPSILFLDEPTSGLDARAAAIVMRGIKRVAQEGRAVCATIHQPSVAIFDDFDSLLLLKRGGEVVFFGELGGRSTNLIQYLERYDATPRITPGENPATWMLQATGAGSSTSGNKMPFDYAGAYSQSSLRKRCFDRIEQITESAALENKVAFSTKYATSTWMQYKIVIARGLNIYHRSPSYNTIRTTVSAVVALLFASVYAADRIPQNESDMNSRINSLFVAVTFLCSNAVNSVLRVIEVERNMFYRHEAAQMYDAKAFLAAFTLSEIPFIVISSLIFCLAFYFLMGFAMEVTKFFLFFLFVTLALGTFTMLGQTFILLFKDSTTAQGLGGLVISLNALFSGVFIKPQAIPLVWIFLYYVLPGHWIMEGLFASQFVANPQIIDASYGSPFFLSLNCTTEQCSGTVGQWMDATYPNFSSENIKWDAVYVAVFIVMTRLISMYALYNINYRAI